MITAFFKNRVATYTVTYILAASFAFVRQIKEPAGYNAHIIFLSAITLLYIAFLVFGKHLYALEDITGRAINKNGPLLMILLIALLTVSVFLFSLHFKSFSATDESDYLAASEYFYKYGFKEFFDSFYRDNLYANNTGKHPPLLPMMIGSIYKLCGMPNKLAARGFIIFCYGLTLYITYFLARKSYGLSVAAGAVSILGLMPFFFRRAIFVEQDIILACVSAGAIYLAIQGIEEKNILKILSFSMLIMFGVFIKYTLVLILPVILIYTLFSKGQKKYYLWFLFGLSVAAFICYIAMSKRIEALNYQVNFIKCEMLRTGILGAYSKKFLAYMANIIYSMGIYNFVFIAPAVLWALADRKNEKIFVLWFCVIFVLLTILSPINRYYTICYVPAAILIAYLLRKLPPGIRFEYLLFTLACSAITVIFYYFVGWSPPRIVA